MSTTLSAPRPSEPRLRHAARVRPRWELPGLAVLLVATAGLYLWNLAATGFGNAFYAAAVQAGTQNWKAFFFGSLDSANLITVDKPPASLWVMELSGRIFGFSSWSMLAPQALMAVAAVALMWATVRRIGGPGAGLLACALFALTPVTALMFRYNNPDAFLVLLLVVACYFTVRALEQAGTRWIVLAGLFIGFAFLAKELQAFLVVPGLAPAYLWAAPTSLGRRVAQLLGAGVALVVGAGWWVLAVAVWPAADRPWIGGSTDNSELGRAFGYNGLGRIFGGGFGGRGGSAAPTAASDAARDAVAAASGAARDAAGRAVDAAAAGRTPGGGGFGGGFGGQSGILRMFQTEVGGQVAWLLPAALILLVAGLWLTRRARGGARLGVREQRGRADHRGHRGVGVGAARPHTRLPALAALDGPGARAADRPGLLIPAGLRGRPASRWPRSRWSSGRQARRPTPSRRPSPPTRAAGSRQARPRVAAAAASSRCGAPTTDVRRGPPELAAARQRPIAQARPPGRRPGGAAGGAGAQAGTGAGARAAGGAGVAAGSGRGGPGGFGGGAPSAQLTALLESAGTKWSAATVGSSAAASLELASSTAVMGIGGFTGADPAPTPAQFQADVAAGQVHYFLSPTTGARGGGGFGGSRGGGVGAAITQWVQQHYTATTVGGESVYDLAAPKA